MANYWFSETFPVSVWAVVSVEFWSKIYKPLRQILDEMYQTSALLHNTLSKTVLVVRSFYDYKPNCVENRLFLVGSDRYM